MRSTSLSAGGLLLAFLLAGQPVLAQAGPATPPLTADQQVASAVLPLPDEFRASASVLGYDGSGALVPLRKGSGEMICLASNPAVRHFHVACYHQSLEPFMARGRELRTRGVQGDQVDTLRFAEAKAGTLKLPGAPASLYSISGDSYDPATGQVAAGRRLYVVYIPYATAASTGLPEEPVRGVPWIMFPGTPKAHIMFIPEM